MLGARTSIERPLRRSRDVSPGTLHDTTVPYHDRAGTLLRQVDSLLDIQYHAGDILIEGFSAF